MNALSALAGLPPVPVSTSAGATIPPILLGGYGQSLNALTSGNFTSAQVGVQFSLPLRNRTANAQVAFSVAEGHRLKTQRQQIEMAIEQDVRNALQTASSARSRLDAATTARQYAEQQYSSEQRQFQAGTSTVFLVLQRQTDLIAARTREVRARRGPGRSNREFRPCGGPNNRSEVHRTEVIFLQSHNVFRYVSPVRWKSTSDATIVN